jgi:lysophospholipase L1-like esterase
VPADSADTFPHGLRLYTFTTTPDAGIEVTTVSGNPEIFGLVVESNAPGLVIDALGINGARFATSLAWDEESWLALVRWRRPALAVIAYGTNEVFDAAAPEKYGDEIARLIRRLRAAAPDIDCLLAGPTDVGRGGAEAEDRAAAIDRIEQQTAAQLGCAYFSLYQAMGGANGFEQWLHSAPPLASPDRIHLSAAGYRRLGLEMATFILASP